STMISWSYYGDRCATYLFGSKAVMPYRIIFCMFSGIGAMVGLETVWAYGDIALGLMSIPNLLAILLLSGTTLSLTRDYFARMDAKSAE
ncbi:MAG: alanine:cation symporter family protein, partial [Myxococcota bacterium]